MSVFYRDIDVKISDYKSELSKPLVIYERDRGLEIYFNLKEYAYKYDKKPSNLLENLVGAYATVTLVNPSGYEIRINEVEITEDAKVKFVITEDLTDELTEIGTYQLQIHINNDVEGRDTSVFSIPPFNFEVRERLKGSSSGGSSSGGGLLDSEGNRLTDKEGHQLVNTSTNKIINFSTDEINEYLSSVPTMQGEVKKLNSQLDKIVSLSNNSNVDLMRTKRIAHRGYNVLAPENSIPAYELAAEYGFWGGECDVTETLDNEFVLMHDDTIDRTTNGTGKVSSYTLEQLKNFNIDVGNNISLYPNLKIPTLDEFLLTCKKIDLVPVIEIKSISDSNIDKFLDKIRSYGFINKAIIISFNYDLLVKIRNKENRVMLQPLLDLTQENINKCVALGVNTHIDCPYSQVTKENIELAHKKGLLVNAWTVNGENKLNELIDYGIDFITTDKLFDEETVKYKLKNNLSISANQISSIQLGESRNKVGLTYEEIIIKSSLSNRCSTVNRFYRALNDTVVINMPTEYKLTLMPFDATGAYLRDYGWFTNGEIDISHHTDVDHYHIYFARVDGANFTENDISILKQKVSVFFKTKANTTSNRKYVFLINGSPMALQSAYSADICTVTYDGDSTKTFTLTHDIPLSAPCYGVAFGNISLSGDLDMDIRVKGESKTGFKFAFIKKSTNTLLTEAEVNRKSWLYFNLIHMG